MLGNGIVILVFILLVLGLLFLARAAWRSSKLLVRWGGLLVSGLLALLFAALTAFSVMGMRNMYAQVNVPVPDVTVDGTPQQIARGEHLANSFCTSCHSTTGELPLTGGVDLGKDIPMPLGKFITANLTPAGPLKGWTDGEIFRALRNGVAKNGRRLGIMQGVRARNLSDEDLKAVIAYLRSTEAVQKENPEQLDQPTVLGLIMSGAGMIPTSQPIIGAVSAPPMGATAEYGQYILSYNDCRDCHGEDLTGGVKGQLAPIGPHLGAVRGWTAGQFITAMRTGMTPSGKALQPPMPWKSIGRLDDDELTALYLAIVHNLEVASLPQN